MGYAERYVPPERRIPPDELNQMLRRLADHYGESVRPISEVCDALTRWGEAILEAKQNPPCGGCERCGGGKYSHGGEYAEHFHRVTVDIAKSSLLGRLLYGGEAFRTRICPEHKGHWSGLEYEGNECPHGCQLTGWLPEPESPTTMEE